MSAVYMGQEKFSCPAGQRDTGTACLTTVQAGSDLLISVEPHCSGTEFSFWKTQGHLEGYLLFTFY